jgi:hypothetical protein
LAIGWEKGQQDSAESGGVNGEAAFSEGLSRGAGERPGGGGALMRYNALKGVILTAGGKGRDESDLDAGFGDGHFGKGVFDRRIHWFRRRLRLCRDERGFVFFSHHSEWSDAVPKTFCEILFIPLNT